MPGPSRRRAVLAVIASVSGLCTLSACATSGPVASNGQVAPQVSDNVVSVSIRAEPTPTSLPPTATAAPTAARTPPPERPAGRVLFTHAGNVWLWAPDGVHQVTSGGNDLQPAWSPDGRQIAYVAGGPGFSDIVVLDVESGQARRLTQHRGTRPQNGSWAFRPAWSPDGRQIAYVSDAATYHPALWLVNADGTGRRQITAYANGRGGVDGPAWTPDGKTIILTAYPMEGPAQLFAVELPAVRIRQITSLPATVYDAAVSPVGGMLAFVTLDASGNSIWTAPVEGSPATRAVEGDRNRAPAWSPDDGWLAYIAGTRNDEYRAYAVPLGREGTHQAPVLLSGSRPVLPGGGLSWGA